MPKYYATRLTQSFRSTADVLAFSAKRARDAYVAQHDEAEHSRDSHTERLSCRAITKRDFCETIGANPEDRLPWRRTQFYIAV